MPQPDDAALQRLVDLALRAARADAAELTAPGCEIASGATRLLADPRASRLSAPLERHGGGTVRAAREPDGLPWTGGDREALALAASAVADHLRGRGYRDIAVETTALQHVATVVARSTTPGAVYDAVCRELPPLVGAPIAAVSRLPDGGPSEILATVGIEVRTARELCDALWECGRSGPADAYRAGEVFQVEDTANAPGATAADAARYRACGIRTVVGAPVLIGERLWGAITVGSPRPAAIRPERAQRLTRFARLIALAVTNAEDRSRLAAQATSDSLTGLANHRRFHEELRHAAAQAERQRLPLALALLDVDDFKQVNDALGHDAGDGVLRTVANALADCVREGELVARLGGDEFAAILPGSDDAGAEAFANRVRERVAAARGPAGHAVTVSVGVTDLAHAGGDPDQLRRLADSALYSAKEQGRNAVCRYSRDVAFPLGSPERADRLARSQALTALRALARALDLRDPSTQRHAERVASLVQRMAVELGWAPGARERLGEAALLHDIGKIAVADKVLHKPGPLDDQEYGLIKAHAPLGAEIASEALDGEQVRWVEHHHERWDGCGYPAGLCDGEIPEGAWIIAAADAFDVMTTARHYREPVSCDEALAECRRLSGRQFAPRAVEALHAAVSSTALGVGGGRL